MGRLIEMVERINEREEGKAHAALERVAATRCLLGTEPDRDEAERALQTLLGEIRKPKGTA